MDRIREDAFRDFVRGRSTALLRTAYLLVGDRGRAEDLLQAALVKTYLARSRIRDMAAVESYVRRTMVTTAISRRRGRRYRERMAGPPERDPIWAQLRALPAKQRAVLVLRCYEGMPELEIAEMLGLTPGAVRSQASRALAALRRRLAEELTDDLAGEVTEELVDDLADDLADELTVELTVELANELTVELADEEMSAR
jgi:RNA polymerase sigma-70 factor (sigma-E family)